MSDKIRFKPWTFKKHGFNRWKICIHKKYIYIYIYIYNTYDYICSAPPPPPPHPFHILESRLFYWFCRCLSDTEGGTLSLILKYLSKILKPGALLLAVINVCQMCWMWSIKERAKKCWGEWEVYAADFFQSVCWVTLEAISYVIKNCIMWVEALVLQAAWQTMWCLDIMLFVSRRYLLLNAKLWAFLTACICLGAKILQHLAGGSPKVLGSMPIRPLRCPNFTGKRNRPELAWCREMRRWPQNRS